MYSAAFFLFGVVKSRRYFICSRVLVLRGCGAQLDTVYHDALFKWAFLRGTFCASLSDVVVIVIYPLSGLVYLESHFVESILDIMPRLGRHLHIKHFVSLGKEIRLLCGHTTLDNHIWASALRETRHRLHQVKFKPDEDFNNAFRSVCRKVLKPKG